MDAMLELISEYKDSGKSLAVILNGSEALVTVEDIAGSVVKLKQVSGNGIFYAHYSNIVISAAQ